MAAGAEVSGETAVLDMVSPAVVVKTISEEKIEKIDKSGDTDDVTDGLKDSDSNSDANSKSELQMKEIVDMLKNLKLNPMAKEFFPSSYYNGHMEAHNFVPNDKNLGNYGFPNHPRVPLSD